MFNRLAPYITVLAFLLLVSCKNDSKKQDDSSTDISKDSVELEFADDNSGLSLPDDFKVVTVAEDIGAARRIVIRENGDMYISLNSNKDGKVLVALRDTTGNGQADVTKYFGELKSGTGLRLYKDYLYYGSDTAVVRFKLDPDKLVPNEDFEIIAVLPDQNVHETKSIAIDDKDNLYVNVGAPSNACQEEDRKKGSMGQDPCPLLEKHGGIWKFDANKLNQSQDDGSRYVTGVRNAVALDWDPTSKALYAVVHGRDQLYQNFPENFNAKQGAELPAEEFFKFEEGKDYGWPYTYWDPKKDAPVVAPEYGGDGEKTDNDSDYEKPIMSFPAHWAPNGLVFYTGDQFPDKYKKGAFVAFHGSWNRAPEPQKGYKVAYVPFENGEPADDYEIFADDFIGSSAPIESPGDAKYRPNGLHQGPDGSLYITDDKGGTIFRVVYTGND